MTILGFKKSQKMLKTFDSRRKAVRQLRAVVVMSMKRTIVALLRQRRERVSSRGTAERTEDSSHTSEKAPQQVSQITSTDNNSKTPAVAHSDPRVFQRMEYAGYGNSPACRCCKKRKPSAPASRKVGTFAFEDMSGKPETFKLDLMSNDEKLKSRHSFSSNCEFYSVYGSKCSTAPAFMDTCAGSSLMALSVAKKVGCHPDKLKRERAASYQMANGTRLQSMGSYDCLVKLDQSGIFTWIEFAVIDDRVLSDQPWVVLLSQRVCSDASLLIKGPSLAAPCACVRGWHSPYVSKPFRQMVSRPILIGVEEVTPDSALTRSSA